MHIHPITSQKLTMAVILVCISSPTSQLHAATPLPLPQVRQQVLDANPDLKTQPTAEQEKKTAQASNAQATFAEKIEGFGGAGGIAAIFMKGPREVENAEMKDGFLQVDFKSKERVGGFLETHYLFTDLGDFVTPGDGSAEQTRRIASAIANNRRTTISDWSPGLMVGVELGENAIRSVGVGLISSWQRLEVAGDGALTKKLAFNLGIMLLIEQNVKMLADGLEDGKALPPGMTDIRFRNDSRKGIAVTFSAGF